MTEKESYVVRNSKYNKHNFKVGDRVKCIDASRSNRGLTIHNIYTIRKIQLIGEDFFVYIHELNNNYLIGRFIPLITFKQKIKFVKDLLN